MNKTEMIALLLAGGQGSRLGVLTKTVAKPAVSYGGKYRIIDFSLSNCINSGIETVGVLTQYQPLELNAHIGIGKPWDLDRMNGGVTILSPYVKEEVGEWYKGTANAVYQNIHFVDKISPEYVVILSGDHIYKMDYSSMLEYHKRHNADATISVIDVPLDEASRYGIMNTDSTGRIIEFEEKPKEPKSTLASMGIYIFTWEALREYLVSDSEDPTSDNDFGKNIIPNMLRDNKSLWAYQFSGYWRDVGTIDAFWESNMDLIRRVPIFNLFDPTWRIFTPNPTKPAHYIGPNGSIRTSIISEGCMIYGTIKNSVIFPGVFIDEDTVVEDSIIMTNSKIGANTIIRKSILAENSIIGNDVKIGVGELVPNENKPSIYYSGISVVGENSYVPDNAELGKNVVIDRCVTTDDYCSLQVPSGKSVFKGGVCE